MRKYFFILMVLFAVPSLAQNSGFSIQAEGSASPIILTEVRKLPEAARTKDTTLPTPKFSYGIQTKRQATTFPIDTIKAAKMGSEPLPKLYRSYARIGVGNYSTIAADFSYMSGRSKNGSWGIHAGHISAGSGPKNVNGEYSGFSSQNAGLYGKRFLKKHELSGNADYDRDVVYNYGSPVAANVFTKEYSQQRYNFFSTGAGLKSFYSDSSAINHKIGLQYQHLNERFGVQENRILFDVNAGRYIRTEFLSADLGVDHNRVSSENDTAVSTIVRFTPTFAAHGKKFEASAGVSLVHETDGEGATYFFPQAYVSYDIVNHIIIPYLSLKGGVDRNNLRSLSVINPYMISSSGFALKNTRRVYELEVGLKGSLSSQVFYQLHGSRYELRNAPFFVNTDFAADRLQNKFAVVYDDAEVLHLGGQLGWQFLEKIKVVAGGDWFRYTMGTELRPWHTPTLRLSLLAQYNIQDKIIGRMQVYYLNGQYARTGTQGNYSEVLLKGLVDVNVGLEYRYNKFLSLYVNFNNIASQRYYRWNAYPTQRFNLLGGLTYTF